jgi:sugar lactone lactonase YvrE
VAVDAAGLLYVSDEENHAIHILTPPGSASVYINTFAGEPGVTGTSDATGTQARFHRPLGLAVRDHILYVADFANGALRTVTTGREVGTLAAAGLGGPDGITTDAAGNIYIADKTAHVIRKVAAAAGGAGLVVAGRLDSAGADDGSGTAARFHAPAGVAWAPGAGASAAGILYIADTGNHIIRKLDLGDGARVTTLAGNAGVPGWADGAGDDVLFDSPEGVAADIDGTLYIADTGNSLVREIAPGGWVGTVAGAADAGALAGIAGFKDATGTAALFNHPRGVALGRGRELYIADTGNRAIRRIGLDNNVQTLLAIPPAQNPGQPSNPGGGGNGGGGGGGALPAWYFMALSALLLSKAAGFRSRLRRL